MSKRNKHKNTFGSSSASTPSPAVTVPLASTGHSRRDKYTHSTFTRLSSHLPLLSSNSAARDQLTQIIFSNLIELRKENHLVELCDKSLTKEGCNLCAWKQKNFCEVCGTDFALLSGGKGGAGIYPLFLPSYSDSLLHIDTCMLCSEKCVDKMMEKKMKEAEEAEAAGITSKNGASTSSSSGRLTQSTSDPHISFFSILFHVLAYLTYLYLLHIGDYTIESIRYYLTGWMLLAGLSLHALWLLNITMSYVVGGKGVRKVWRIRQTLSYLASITAVLTAVTSLLYWGLVIVKPRAVLGSAELSQGGFALFNLPMVEYLKHGVPPIVMALEAWYFPHVKISPFIEFLLCLLVPSSFLLASYHKRYYSSFLVWPYPLFNILTTVEHWFVFITGLIVMLVCVIVVLRKAKEWRWKEYVVPGHLQIE